MIVTICLNGVLAVAICWLTLCLWRWRDRLIQLNQALTQTALSSQRTGYTLTIKRAQIAQTRLALAQIQARSQKIVQMLKLIRTVRALLIYRDRLKS